MKGTTEPYGSRGWINGNGVPTAAGNEAQNGFHYLDLDNGDVYVKQAGNWLLVGNLAGPTGPAGPTGAQGPQGEQGPGGGGGSAMIPPMSIMARTENLQITRPTTSTLNITADMVIVDDQTDPIALDSSYFPVSCDITVTGAGGLAAGEEGEQADLIYYVWLIYDDVGDDLDSFLTSTPDFPTLPGPYTYAVRVGAVANNFSSDFLDFVQYENVITYRERAVNTFSLGATDQWSVANIAVIPIIPQIAKRMTATFSSSSAYIGVSTASDGFGGAFSVGAVGPTTFMDTVFGSSRTHRFTASIGLQKNFGPNLYMYSAALGVEMLVNSFELP